MLATTVGSENTGTASVGRPRKIGGEANLRHPRPNARRLKSGMPRICQAKWLSRGLTSEGGFENWEGDPTHAAGQVHACFVERMGG